MAKCMIKLRIFRGSVFTVLCEWALSTIVCILMREMQRKIRKTERRKFEDRVTPNGVMCPAKEQQAATRS